MNIKFSQYSLYISQLVALHGHQTECRVRVRTYIFNVSNADYCFEYHKTSQHGAPSRRMSRVWLPCLRTHGKRKFRRSPIPKRPYSTNSMEESFQNRIRDCDWPSFPSPSKTRANSTSRYETSKHSLRQKLCQ